MGSEADTTVSARLPALRATLLAWYDAQGRDLPWRRDRDAWAVLCSELMLQQTQVARVAARLDAFLARFPDAAAMAGAPVADVIAEWRGLGYNRRAVSLHRAAQAIVLEHGGRVPRDLADLEALPGVGPYTARAVAAFAYGHVAAPVDVNVGRVLARAVSGEALGPAALQRLADAAVPGERPGAWSHALMDLGGRHCTARVPDCGGCPILVHCAWRATGDPDRDPAARGPARGRPQRRFEGSDRWHRGRLVDALRAGPLPAERVAEAAGLESEPARLERIVAGLVADGLAVADNAGGLRLPDRL